MLVHESLWKLQQFTYASSRTQYSKWTNIIRYSILSVLNNMTFDFTVLGLINSKQVLSFGRCKQVCFALDTTPCYILYLNFNGKHVKRMKT